MAVDAAGIVYVLDAAGKVARYVQGGRVNISLDVTPGFFDNFPFATSGGLFPASFTLDNCNGGSCTTKSTAGPAGSGYSISQNLPAGWEQASATCDDGSDPSSITLSDGEVVNCHFTNRKLGTIVVKQDTQPDGEGQDFDYTAGGGLSPTTFTLDDDSDPALSNTQTFENLQPSSSYSIAQSSTPAGWNPAQVTCSDGSNPSAIDVSYGETVTCTFVNRSVDSGTITVKLDAPDSPSSLHFSFATTGFGAAAPSSFSLTNGGFPPSQVTFVVHAGSGYGVTQTSNNTGYDASASCSDGSPTSAIDVSTGEDVTCTFINQRRPVVTVALSTQPAQDNQVFTFTPSSGFGVSSFSLDNDGFQQNELPSARAFYLPPGHQSVSIDPVAGWNVVSSGCTNGSPVSDIAVQYRDVVTCTFTVEPVNPGSLTLILDTAPDDDTRFVFRVNGGSFYPGIALQDNGNEADGILKQHTVSASAYAHYTVSLFSTNPSGTSYRQVQATCSDGSPISDLNISPGENVTCTLVYAKPQSITVVQDTVPDDPQDFSYTTGAGLAPASFTLDDDGSDATDKPRSQTFSGLSPGTYSVSQVPANGNYQSASCSDGSSPASIDLSANEDVVCTFVNRPGGPGYPRPKAATPLMMPLVPAYEDCFVPNGVHAAPFSFGSCAPPTRTSSRLTIGTPDANAQPARSVSYLKLVRLVGDLRVIAHVDDVFSSSDLSDYTGELEARFSLKLTDKASQPLPTIATTQQFGLSVAIPCTATADTATGAACDLITDLNTLLPGAIVDGRRAMLETGPAEVYDGGADSDADTPAGNGLFMRQGVFVP